MSLYMSTKMRAILRAIEKLEASKAIIEEKIEVQKQKLMDYIIEIAGEEAVGNFKQKSDTGAVNWFIPSKAKRFNQEDFRRDYPELFEKYKKESEIEPKPQLRITFPKPKI